MTWHPSTEEKEYLQCILSMTIDCMMGKGTDTVETYGSNLKIAANGIQKIEAKPLLTAN